MINTPDCITVAAAEMELAEHLDPMLSRLSAEAHHLRELGYHPESKLYRETTEAYKALFALMCSYQQIVCGPPDDRKPLDRGPAT